MNFVWRQLRAMCFSGVWLLIEAIHLFILQIYTMLGGFVYFVLHYNRGMKNLTILTKERKAYEKNKKCAAAETASYTKNET